MNEQYACPAHGHMLTKALNEDGTIVQLPDALKAREQHYYCPNPECGIRVVPEGGCINRATDFYRHGHFNALPGIPCKRQETYTGPKKSLTSLVKEAIASGLTFSRDFDVVETDLLYSSFHRQKADTEYTPKQPFTVDIFCRREGRYGMDTILHVVELPLKGSCNDLYQKVREIAFELPPSRKKRVLESNSGTLEIAQRIYQNFIVVMNEHSYKPAGQNAAELPPTVHNFIGDLSGPIYFFDLEHFIVSDVKLSSPEPVPDTPPKNPNRIFHVHKRDMPYFSLEGIWIGNFAKELRNWKGRNSVHITAWKKAVPIPLDIDENGNPVSVFRNGGQGEFLL